MALGPERVSLQSLDSRLRVVGRLTEEVPQFTGGIGGWEVVQRPGRRPLTVWRGYPDPLTLTLPLVIDGFDDGESTEKVCSQLEQMGGSLYEATEPPKLIVSGLLPHMSQEGTPKSTLWVVNGLEWHEYIRDAKGDRIRQFVTVTLIRFNEDDRLARTRRKLGGTTKAKANDTYNKIARRALDDIRYGNLLARLNGKNSGDAKVKMGKSVKLPTEAQLKAWKRKVKRR